jgi:hypothetical protein
MEGIGIGRMRVAAGDKEDVADKLLVVSVGEQCARDWHGSRVRGETHFCTPTGLSSRRGELGLDVT